MGKKIEQFEDLNVWQKAYNLSLDIYKITQESEFNRDFGLRDQIRRSGVSVVSNIAERFERESTKEFIRFLIIAKGSCGEVRTQLRLSKDIGYITEEKYKGLNRNPWRPQKC